MYMTMTELASEFGCSHRTITRRVTEMRRSGMYPKSVLAGIGKLRVNREDFEDFLQRKGRMMDERED